MILDATRNATNSPRPSTLSSKSVWTWSSLCVYLSLAANPMYTTRSSSCPKNTEPGFSPVWSISRLKNKKAVSLLYLRGPMWCWVLSAYWSWQLSEPLCSITFDLKALIKHRQSRYWCVSRLLKTRDLYSPYKTQDNRIRATWSTVWTESECCQCFGLF